MMFLFFGGSGGGISIMSSVSRFKVVLVKVCVFAAGDVVNTDDGDVADL